jgi:hypothetical protein
VAFIFAVKEYSKKECYVLHAGFLLGLFFDPEDGGDMLYLLTFNGPHGVISQEIELFITPCSRILLEKLQVAQPLKKLLIFGGIRRFSIVFTRALH